MTLFSGFRIEGGQTSSGEKLDAISFATGRLSQTNGQVRLAHSRRAQKDDPFPLGDEMALAQVEDAFLVEGGQRRKIEVGDVLLGGETGFLEASLTGFPLALCYF